MYTRFRSCKCRLLPFSTAECNLFYVYQPIITSNTQAGPHARYFLQKKDYNSHIIFKTLTRIYDCLEPLDSGQKVLPDNYLEIGQKSLKMTKCCETKNFLNCTRNSILTDRADRFLKENETFSVFLPTVPSNYKK